MRLHNRTRGARASHGGFSLAELMVVIVIIGLLVGLVAKNVMKNLSDASITTAKADISTILNGLQEYAINNAGRYPDTLDALVTPDERGYTILSQETIPVDPWKNEYQYEPPGPGQPKPLVYSFGSDGARGGEGDAKDITSEDLTRK
jgi:general secretion pathway protein G